MVLSTAVSGDYATIPLDAKEARVDLGLRTDNPRLSELSSKCFNKIAPPVLCPRPCKGEVNCRWHSVNYCL